MSSRFDPLIGAALLARGRAEGMARFGSTPQAFLASLAPMIALPLVGCIILLLSGNGLLGVSALLVTVVAQLAPPVLSHALAAQWGRADLWLRYATAFNWCQWAIPVVALALMVVLQAGLSFGLGENAAVRLLGVGLAAYGLWLHWLLARHGLALPGGRAAALVALVNIGTIALLLVPGVVMRVLE